MKRKECFICVFFKKCTILFNFFFSNNKGISSRHIAATNNGPDKISDKIVYILHAVGAKRCHNILLETECTNGCAWNKEFNGLPPPRPVSMPVRIN